eukprot:6077306-Lingulodinium_polyedra.AAC.1
MDGCSIEPSCTLQKLHADLGNGAERRPILAKMLKAASKKSLPLSFVNEELSRQLSAIRQGGRGSCH